MAARAARPGGGDGSPQDWFYSLGPVTRCLLVASLGSTLGCSMGVLNPMSLGLFWDPLLKKFEVWRLASNFVFFGEPSFNFLISVYMLVQYSSKYEASPFNTGGGGSSSDFAWMLCVCATILSGLGFVFGLAFLAPSLSFCILYVWCRKNPDESVSLFGFKMQALYLPWALMAFYMLIGNGIFLQFIGVVAGHAFYFAHYIAPGAYGYTVIKTPVFLIEAFGGAMPRPPPGRQAPPPPRPYAGHGWGTGNVLGAN